MQSTLPNGTKMQRFKAETLTQEFIRVLNNRGFREDRALACAQLFTEASIDGVYSHGVNRFPRFIQMVDLDVIKVNAEATLVNSLGALERWDGNAGPGNLNAQQCMARTLKLARQNGMGCVALSNSNHWMRGGSYGWQAARAGMIGICWTNTNQNLPAWGAKDRRIGNNPLIIAVPRNSGDVVLDMAMSQFSYGAIEKYRLRGEELPIDGGYNLEGELSKNPSDIEAAVRLIPTGYWKGSGLSIMLDLVAAFLSGGNAVNNISADPLKETGLSQIFLAFDPEQLSSKDSLETIANNLIQHIHDSEPAQEDVKIYYPGERTLMTRKENLAKGIPVDSSVWEAIKAL